MLQNNAHSSKASQLRQTGEDSELPQSEGGAGKDLALTSRPEEGLAERPAKFERRSLLREQRRTTVTVFVLSIFLWFFCGSVSCEHLEKLDGGCVGTFRSISVAQTIAK